MSSHNDSLQELIRVKLQLADKYHQLARTRKSKGSQARLHRHAERFRRQAERLSVGCGACASS